jgi:nicotinate-nucleotide adenylyltransferase
VTNAARRGWLGGTFDPIHHGHLDVARAAHEMLALTSVTLVPASVPPHRPQPHASPDHRLAMTQLAATESWLDVSAMELEADGPSYTATTMDRLEAEGVDLGSLVVVTGADAFAGILSWNRATALLDRVSFVVVSRPGYPAPRLAEALPSLASRMCTPANWATSSHPCIVLVDAPTSPVSSTMVRAAIAAGQPLTGLVPAPVASYIAAHGLYRRS